MATGTDIPVTVEEEAREWIAQVGMVREFAMMLEHTKKTVPGLQWIKVEFDSDPSQTIGPGIIIWAHRSPPTSENNWTDREWGAWKVETFPPEVCLNFVLLSTYGEIENGR
jgi:hypothetical protein